MGSTFGTYNIAYSGMRASQAGLVATSNNLTNIDTTGASRVRVEATDRTTTDADGTSLVNGVDVASVTRARDQLLDSAYRTENAAAGYWSVKNGDLEYMQELLSEYEGDSDNDEVSDTGIQQAITDFFTAWNTLATDPSSDSSRQSLLETGTTLVNKLSSLDSDLAALQDDAVTGVKDGVDNLNSLASQVATLNQQILTAENSGSGEASYLRDQRDELLDEMSSLADIKVSAGNGTLTVSVGGVDLVAGNEVHELTVAGTGTAADPLTIQSGDFDCGVNIGGGSIAAYMEEADTTGYQDITSGYDYSAEAPSSITNLRQALNDLVTTIATQINSLHETGYGIDDNATTGLDFFTTVDSSKPLSISNIQVNPALVADTDLVAASVTGEAGDNSIATAITDLENTDCYSFDGLELDIGNFYKSVISWVGTAGDTAASNYSTQTALVNQVESQRQAVSSISSDEELSNMIQYQQAYSANARVISTIDTLIGDMIDEIG